MAGRIIWFHGASSAGKTTLARALQAELDEPFLHLSIDHLRDSGALPLARFRSGEFDWPAHRGRFFEGFHAALAGFAAAGNDLIVEHIIETPRALASLIQRLAMFDVFLVEVHCPLQELERREKARADRPVGDARRDIENIGLDAVFDLEVDGTVPAPVNARQVFDAWTARGGPSAFERMMPNRLCC